jgi:hypothetical protein
MPLDSALHSIPSLESLSSILRDQAKWPEGFQWDYTNCSSCAIGLAFKLWTDQEPEEYAMDNFDWLECELGVPWPVADVIFMNLERKLGVRFADVTPVQVADAIDQWITNQAKEPS